MVYGDRKEGACKCVQVLYKRGSCDVQFEQINEQSRTSLSIDLRLFTIFLYQHGAASTCRQCCCKGENRCS
jgi:hypothetical protein